MTRRRTAWLVGLVAMLAAGGAPGAALAAAPSVSGVETDPLTYTEDGPPVAVSQTLTVTDPDSATLSGARVEIDAGFAAGQDVLGFADQNGITGAYDAATGVLTLAGAASVDDYQAALRSVTYRNTSEDPSADRRAVAFFADDGTAASAGAQRDVDVVAVNDAPVLGPVEGDAARYREDDPPVQLTAAITVTDVDSPLIGATVQITRSYHPDQDVLDAPAQNGISTTFDPSSGKLTLSGTATAAAYEAALRSVTYRNTSQDPSADPRGIDFRAGDGVGPGHVSNVRTRTVAVTPEPDFTRTDYPAGSGPGFMTFGDATTDGDGDLVVSDAFSGRVAILPGSGGSTFLSGSSSPGVPFNTLVGQAILLDADQDGDLDLAVTEPIDDRIAVSENALTTVSSGGTIFGFARGFQPPVDYETGDNPGPVATADVNGDGDPDLVVANARGGSVTVLVGRSGSDARGFGGRVDYPVGGTPEDLVVTDVTGDGDPDIVVLTPAGVVVRPGIAGAGFGPLSATQPAGPRPGNLAAADVDGDGDADLAVLDENSASDPTVEPGVRLLLNDGSGGFADGGRIATVAPLALGFGDVNGDGDQDLLVTDSILGDNTLSVYLGARGASFEHLVDLPTGRSPAWVVAGNFDSERDRTTGQLVDRDVDIAVSNFDDDTVSAFTNGPTPGGGTPTTGGPPPVGGSGPGGGPGPAPGGSGGPAPGGGGGASGGTPAAGTPPGGGPEATGGTSGTAAPPAASLARRALPARVTLDRRGRVVVTCRLARVGTARTCRLALIGRGARAAATHVLRFSTARLRDGRATLRLGLSRALRREVRAAGRRGVVVRLKLQALDEHRRPVASASRAVRLRART